MGTNSSFISKFAKDQSGTASVEFAMIALGFLTMIFGVIEVGRLAWTTNVVDYAIDESARYAALHQDASSFEVEEEAKKVLRDLFVPSENLIISVNTNDSGDVSFIEIAGNYRFDSMAGGLFPDSFSHINLAVTAKRAIYSYE